MYIHQSNCSERNTIESELSNRYIKFVRCPLLGPRVVYDKTTCTCSFSIVSLDWIHITALWLIFMGLRLSFNRTILQLCHTMYIHSKSKPILGNSQLILLHVYNIKYRPPSTNKRLCQRLRLIFQRKVKLST